MNEMLDILEIVVFFDDGIGKFYVIEGYDVVGKMGIV